MAASINWGGLFVGVLAIRDLIFHNLHAGHLESILESLISANSHMSHV